ncbi:MrcB family domain-containing protein [Cohnella lupini]|uniref:Dynein-related subfamily AAA family protein n=1 Tax=Cohnella lupini TaxID=1294267 RepID=A0A3D9I9X3_9BACL|nr:DUF3578 domain-containing protein [Cohnella lupini]RED58511.1 dynein-related subfamily AAA family protein [Cohnella lupini]
MELPSELASIFRIRQKSYKMVLILSIVKEFKENHSKQLSIQKVAERFLTYYRDAHANGLNVDSPPSGIALSWYDFTAAQTKALLKTPIDALSSILNSSTETISFKPEIWDTLNTQTLSELESYATTELNNYNAHIASNSSQGSPLRDALSQILNHYSQAKTETFANHSLGTLVRQTIPEYIRSFLYIDHNYKIQGSIGQGNWATIPWIAILDKRNTETTQQGEYVVYLFAEDMSSVYLTLNQGVTVPTREKGRRDGYRYLEQKVEAMREQLTLEGLQKDSNIQLTSSGIGRDYQVSTVAYIKYDRENLPDEDQLLSDLQNVMENYKQYMAGVTRPTTLPVFKYTMAYLYYGQGIINYLGSHQSSSIPITELISNQSIVLKSGEDAKHAKERIQHVGRALQELGLLIHENGNYLLTTQGTTYFQEMNDSIWKLSTEQSQILREHLEASRESNATTLVNVINLAISLAQELDTFTFIQFKDVFISGMGIEEEWSNVTQDNRTRFMLNWLEELLYIVKTNDEYRFQAQEEVEPMDMLSVPERITAIKTYIRSQGFYYPNALIENLYLSFKTKPFVILAGVSGTGKTKLVKLFAEALGATRDNNQFCLIPVRPDWSDPSDLLGYKDLTGAFRPGRLSEVLVEASKESNRHKPYFICLDEMNLARVEHYFSDLLSVIETQEWKNDRIVTHPLIQSNSLSVDDQSVYGNLSLPDNVYLLGTVNMDETTHPFSKKVLDRANTIEFNFIDLEQYPIGIDPITEVLSLTAPNSFLRSDYLQLVDVYEDEKKLVETATKKLVKVNGILEQIHSHVGFRIRDSVCFYMIYNKRFQLMSDNEAFDLQLLQKILPRVQGSNTTVKRVLLLLMQEALGRVITINQYEEDATELIKNWLTIDTGESATYPHSARKIAFMIRRLEEDGFTSYWLS